MKLIIVSTRQHLPDYNEFVESLNTLGVEALVVHNLEYCFLTTRPPLHTIPIPKLLKLVKRFDPDFVMTDSIYYVPHMLKLVNRRVLFHMRGDAWNESYWDRFKFPSLIARIYSHYLYRLGRHGIKKTDLILPNSKWLQKTVRQHLPSHPTQVLYVGIDPKKWVPNHNPRLNIKHPAAVGLFKFNVYKKVLGFLKFTQVVRKMPYVNFYFAGKGYYMNLARQNCPSNMFLLGWLSRLDAKNLMANGDIFIHPSGQDAFPRCLKEASLLEKPIIASNIGGIPEIVENGETGYLCSLDDVDQWIEKIRFLLDNTNVARKLGENARKYVEEKFDWRKIGQGFLKNLKDFE